MAPGVEYRDVEVMLVTAGDAQRDPADLPALLNLVENGETDYATRSLP